MRAQADAKSVKKPASNSWPRMLCVWIPALLVAIVASVILVYYTGPLPNMDYWYMIPGFLSDRGLDLSFGAFLELSNEHVVVLPKLVYVINYCLTAGNNVGLSIWTAACAATTLALLVKVIGKLTPGLLDAALFSMTVAVFIFNPLAVHNFFWGFSGVAWFTANLLVVFSLFAFSKYLSKGRRVWMFLLVLALLLVSITYTSGLMGWFCVAGYAFLFPRSRRMGYVFGAAFVVMMLIMTIAQSHVTPWMRTYDPVQIAGYAVVYLGGALTPTPEKAVAFGCLGLFLLGAAAWATWGKWSTLSERQRVIRVFWFALAAYVLLNAMLAGFGRSGSGESMARALPSRYAALPSLYWIALLGLAATMLRGWPLRVSSVLGLMAAVYAVHAGVPRVEKFVHGAAGQRVAALGIYLGAEDKTALAASMTTYWPSQVYDVRGRLKKAQHVPFDGMFADCPKMGSKIRTATAKHKYPGYVDRSVKLDSGVTRMDGWIGWKATRGSGRDNKPRACLALASDAGVVVGLAQMAASRSDVRKALGKGYRNRAWTGYVVKHGNGKVHLYAMTRNGSWSLVR